MSNENTAVANLAPADESALNKFLSDLEAQGQIQVRDLFPSLNGFLTEKGSGASIVVKVLDYLQDAVDSDLQPGSKSDVVNVLDVANNVRFAFYCSNGGTKAKFRGVGKGDVLVIFYAGKQKSGNKGFSDWHDFRVIQAANEKVAMDLMAKAKTNLKFLK